jgi:hypothetical protein
MGAEITLFPRAEACAKTDETSFGRGMHGHVRKLFIGTSLTYFGRQRESFDQFATRSRIRAPADHDKVVSKIATSDTISVIACREFSFKNNITGERNGANPERSTGASECGDAIGRPGRGRHVESLRGIRRAETRAPQPQPAERSIADAPGS